MELLPNHHHGISANAEAPLSPAAEGLSQHQTPRPPGVSCVGCRHSVALHHWFFLGTFRSFWQLPVIFPYYRYSRDILSLRCQREGPAGPCSSGASGFEKQLHPPWPWLMGALWQSGGWAGRERMALVDEPARPELWETLLNAVEWTNVPQESRRS